MNVCHSINKAFDVDETTKQEGSFFIFGFDNVKESTQILFAIGKAKKQDVVSTGEKNITPPEASLFQ